MCKIYHVEFDSLLWFLNDFPLLFFLFILWVLVFLIIFLLLLILFILLVFFLLLIFLLCLLLVRIKVKFLFQLFIQIFMLRMVLIALTTFTGFLMSWRMIWFHDVQLLYEKFQCDCFILLFFFVTKYC